MLQKLFCTLRCCNVKTTFCKLVTYVQICAQNIGRVKLLKWLPNLVHLVYSQTDIYVTFAIGGVWVEKFWWIDRPFANSPLLCLIITLCYTVHVYVIMWSLTLLAHTLACFVSTSPNKCNGMCVCACTRTRTHTHTLFKLGTWRPAAHTPGFLKTWNCFWLLIDMYACMSAPNGINGLWHDRDPMWLIKQVLWIFPFLVVFVTLTMDKVNGRGHSNTAHREHLTKKTKVMWYKLQKEHLTVATWRSTLIVKVSRQMHSNVFKRKLAFSLTVIISAFYYC